VLSEVGIAFDGVELKDHLVPNLYRFDGQWPYFRIRPLREIESRITACAFSAVMDPTKGPAVREVLARLAAVLDETSPDGLI